MGLDLSLYVSVCFCLLVACMCEKALPLPRRSRNNDRKSQHLSTFSSNTIPIHLPTFNKYDKYDKYSKKSAMVFDEVFSLMRANFIDRHVLNTSEWNSLYHDHYDPVEPRKAIKRLLQTFNDPYTAHFEPETMDAKQEAFRGERCSAGASRSKMLFHASLIFQHIRHAD